MINSESFVQMCLREFFKRLGESSPDICPVGWNCRIHLLLLYREERPLTNVSPRYDTKPSDGFVSVMLEL